MLAQPINRLDFIAIASGIFFAASNLVFLRCTAGSFTAKIICIISWFKPVGASVIAAGTSLDAGAISVRLGVVICHYLVVAG